MGVADGPQGNKQRRIEALEIMGLETWTVGEIEETDELDRPFGAEEEALKRKQRFEELRPLMMEQGVILAAPSEESLIPRRPVYGTKSGILLEPEAVAKGRRKQLLSLEEQQAILLLPRDFPLQGAKRIRSKWLDDPDGSGEVKSRLVATEVAYGMRRDDCFAGTPPLRALRMVMSLAASRGRRLALFDVVAAFVHALIDELVILYLPDGLGEGQVAVLLKALYGTRKASRSVSYTHLTLPTKRIV